MRILSSPVLVFCLCVLTGLLVVNFVSATREIDINTASLEDLVKIIHIGEVRAKELISLRPFSSLDDLTRIKGIGEARLEDIKEQDLAWVGAIEPESLTQPEPQPQSAEELQVEPVVEVSPQHYPEGVVINEILPSPTGPDAEEEWIEIFNQNNFEVNLSGWQIEDTIGKTKTYTLPEKTVISPQGFLVFYRPETKITLNNLDGDGLKLIQPNGEIANSVEYGKALQGESYNLTGAGWVWSSVLTPGTSNRIPAPLLKTKKAEPSKEEIKTEVKPEKELAAISQQLSRKPSSFPPLLIALAIAIFSGIIILILKNKVKIS